MTLSYLPNLWRGAAIRTPDNAAPLGAGPASMLGPHGRFLFWTGTTIIFMKGPSRGIALPQLDRRSLGIARSQCQTCTQIWPRPVSTAPGGQRKKPRD